MDAARKHGDNHHRTWQEIYIGIINTAAHVHNNTQLKPLIEQVIGEGGCKIKTIIGDGIYDVKDSYLLSRK